MNELCGYPRERDVLAAGQRPVLSLFERLPIENGDGRRAPHPKMWNPRVVVIEQARRLPNLTAPSAAGAVAACVIRCRIFARPAPRIVEEL